MARTEAERELTCCGWRERRSFFGGTMCDKLYALLLRLYPARFRLEYQNEALALVRDRMREERGWRGVRLWIDLLTDFVRSAPRAHWKERKGMVARRSPSAVGIAPLFQIPEEERMRPETVLVAGLVATLMLAMVTFLMSRPGVYRTLVGRGSASTSARAASPSDSGMPQGESHVEEMGPHGSRRTQGAGTGKNGMLVVVQAATATEEEMKFEVASVKRNKAEPSEKNPQSSTFALGPGDAYTRTGGLFTATNMPLVTYIQFAFKVPANQGEAMQAHLPSWVRSDRFDIQARAEGEPTKDQMRLMVRSVLEERFHMSWHRETQQVPVFAMTMAKPGVFGPMLQPHRTDAACSSLENTEPALPLTPDGRFPTVCGGVVGVPPSKAEASRIGGRDVSMALIASTLKFVGELDRPVVDQTGLKGTYDFSVEFRRESQEASLPGVDSVPEDAGPAFPQALKEQTGLKLNSTKAPLETVVIDHIEPPSEN